jgi:NAD(P)-dependent dehydrogenase (short-subunit alcohol dehydrogenase family)
MSHIRTAVVTGAAMGIGRAIALRIATDGCAVVVNDLPDNESTLHALVSEIEKRGAKARAFPADVTVEENVRQLVQTAVDVFGGIDIVSGRIWPDIVHV